ncbi:S24 family peptidase [Snodgrassella sp. CFCC 13594]|uniref:S24 family peptidase n=1 Tax=Snodgrassella sp. CFCC 13594 TaxID=1775559 RepID=UPI0008343554|nr:S24 family peptidase [Snodgrassella sp. CFCC 13594]
MDNFKDRLLSLFPNKTIASISTEIGMSHVGLSKVFSKQTLPKAETLLKINDITGCDLKWLMTGEGEPFRENSNKNQGAPLTPKNLQESMAAYDVFGRPVSIDEFVFIPRYDVKAAAGHGCYNEDDKPVFTMAFRRYWIENYLRADPKDLSVIAVKGDSMEGVLNDGDNILVNHAKKAPGDGLYVLRMGENLIVKRTQLMPDNMLWVTSANEAYEPFGIDISKPIANIEVVGKVEWFGRKI